MHVLTTARDLRRRRARERLGLFVAEGMRTVEELLRAPLVVRGALATDVVAATPRGAALLEALGARGIPLEMVDAPTFATAADTESPQGVLAVAEIPARTLGTLPAPRRILLLDGIQDPGNTGTLLRTAAALAVDATLALPGTVDLWNAKVVRSAMGALFHHPAFGCTWDALDKFLAAHGVPVWGGDAAGAPVAPASAPERLALAVGNEGGGLSAAARARAARLVSIPLAGTVESLNVAVATGILLYQLRP